MLLHFVNTLRQSITRRVRDLRQTIHGEIIPHLKQCLEEFYEAGEREEESYAENY